MGGFGDWISSAWRTTKNAVTKAVTTVKEAVVHVAKKAASAAKSVGSAVAKGVSTVYDDAKSVVSYAGKQIDKYTTAGSNLVGGLGSAIGSPFTWIALAIGGVILLPLVAKAAA